MSPLSHQGYPTLRSVQRYARRVHALPSNQVDFRSCTVDDYTQDLQVKLIEGSRVCKTRGLSEDDTGAFLCRTLQNATQDLQKRRHHGWCGERYLEEPTTLKEELSARKLPADLSNPDAALDAKSCLLVLERALSPEQFNLLLEVACTDLSWAGLAMQRGVSRATLGTRIRHARQNARAAL